MNNKLEVIGIDHGWSMMKTVTQVFVTGVKEITTTPALFGDVLEYDGKYYKIGTVRQEVKDTKVEDDSFYLLTLAAVAKELKKRGLSDAKVFLAVGLPLTRFGAERNNFIKYLTKNKRVDFRYENEAYHIEIDDVAVFPQCYAAVVDKIPTMAKKTLVVDIGSWTIDIMPVINKSPDESKCVTVPRGLITCMRSINEQCVRQLNGEVDETEIQNIMRYGRSDIDDEYLAIIKAEMLDLDVPALRGGKPIIVESEPDWYVKQVMEEFVVRAERIRGGGVDPSVDNFLKITHEARLLGTDARLIDKDAPNNPDGKLNKVAENVWKEYVKGNADGHIGCQLIFSDIGTPGPDKDFTIYDYLKESLIKYGIPAEEIAFIHDAKTDAQRDALFKEMRTGKKKVLIGSTDKCGTGVNVQTHLVAMHHVDCPWKPSSIEQREGRGIRQGNKNDEVAIYRYVTKQTFDAYNWSLVENKQRFISQVMTSKAVSRSCEDIDEATLSYAEIKAVATGNPLIREKMEVDNDVQRLKLLKASYDNQRYGLQDNFMIKYPKLIKTATEKLANVREDIKARDKELIDNPDFAITIGNATYTERVDGGTVMLEAISKCKTGETTPVGKFHGFELLVEKNFLSINYMVLRGKTEYKAELSTSPVGSMVKLENLFNGLHENVDFLEKKIEQYQNDLEASKAEYDKPFAYSAELEEKLARQYELNAQLDLENAKAMDADLGGPDKEKSEDRIENAGIVAEDKGIYMPDRNRKR